VRRPSTAGSGFPRRDDSYVAARPKREVPPPRDQREYHEAPRRAPVKKRFPKRDDGTIEQLKFCTKLIQELYRPKYSSIASPFYDPVDYVKLDLPHYPKVIKKPMDMSSILHKLTVGEYVDARAFHADFKLMIKNCFTFNPAGTPVHQAGVALNEVFDERWASLPPLYGETDDEGEDGEESDNDHSSTCPS
jgi:Bromodomain